VKPKSIGAIVGSYKSAVSNRIGRELNLTGIWQRNYYEHVIRDDEEHNRIHLYIESNIDNWATDDEYLMKSR
jgi:REP element-mobilizing transposase RayT